MKIVECKKGNYNVSLNFVDDNGVFLGYDYAQCCCEDFGYITIKKYETVSENFAYDIEKLDEDLDLEGYSFDKEFLELDGLGELQYATFRCVKENSYDIYLVLYNCHNGYYSHGFEFKDGKELNVKEWL